MRPNQIKPNWARLQEKDAFINRFQTDEAKNLAKDAEAFFKRMLGFKPTAYQQELINFFEGNQFLAARWCRQSGKSWVCNALILNYAYTHPGSWIGVVAPGWRQSKAIIRRIQGFLRKMPGLCPKPSRTVLHLSNGSIIESFPNWESRQHKHER